MSGLPGRGGGVLLGCTISGETCTFPTQILINFLSLLSCKFHQSRSNLSFRSRSRLAPTHRVTF